MDVKGAKILRERLEEAEEQRRFVPRLVADDPDEVGESPITPEPHDDSLE